MNVIIIEDEKPSARLLQRKIESLGYQVIQVIHSVEEGLDYFSTHTAPELILADIQLSDGLSFEIFDTFSLQSSVIFITAYDAYALKAFKLNSIDYLLKPLDVSELKKALEKYETQGKKNNLAELHPLFARHPTYKKRFVVKVGQKLKVIPTEEINGFYSANKATFLLTQDGRSYDFENSLDTVMNEVDPQKFFRVNRQQLVAFDAIREIKVYQQSRLMLTVLGFAEAVVVSRDRVADFKQWIE